MRKIISRYKKDKKKKRNGIIIGLILVGVMLFSILGYSFQGAGNDDIKKFTHKKNKIDLKYKKNTIKGLYPLYHIHLQDDKQNFKADMKYDAKIMPHWSTQESTNGYLPIGFNHYRYGWLLNCDLTGKLKVDDVTFIITGKGYLERVWGNWSYTHPFQILSGLRKTISTYGNLMNWWFSQHKLANKMGCDECNDADAKKNVTQKHQGKAQF